MDNDLVQGIEEPTNTIRGPPLSPPRSRSPPRSNWIPPKSTHIPEWRSRGSGYRRETGIRATILALISDCMTGNLSSAEKLVMLKDIEHTRSSSSIGSGVSFGELLGTEMDKVGVAPLLWEIQTCSDTDDESGELIHWLLKKTISQKLSWMIRTGCRARGDNGLFQSLRYIQKSEDGGTGLDCDVAVDEDEEGICHVMITIENFEAIMRNSCKPQDNLAEAVRRKAASEYQRVAPPSYSCGKPMPKIETEWIVGGRAWRLDIVEEGLDLILLEGGPGTVMATVTVISANLDPLHREIANKTGKDSRLGSDISGLASDLTNLGFSREEYISRPVLFSKDMELTFPADVMLHPLSVEGKSCLSLRPSWAVGDNPPSWYEMVMQSGELMLRLDVQVLQPGEKVNNEKAEAESKTNSTQVAPDDGDKKERGKEDEESGQKSEVEQAVTDDEWEDVLNPDEKVEESEEQSNDGSNWVNLVWRG